MSAKRIMTIVLGVAAVWLLLVMRGYFQPPRAIPELAPIALETPARTAEAPAVSVQEPAEVAEATNTRAAPPQPDTDARDFDSAAAQAPFTFHGSVDTSEPWGRGFEECKKKGRVAISVCKYRFEPSDLDWAPETEQSIRDFVADTGLLRLTDKTRLNNLECRATFCRVYLDIDRVALTDHLRSIGRYNEALARGHEFAYLTLGSRWAHDRAEELRLALVFSGLLEEDSEVAVSAFEPAYREQDSVLEFELSRCPKRDDFCVPH